MLSWIEDHPVLVGLVGTLAVAVIAATVAIALDGPDSREGGASDSRSLAGIRETPRQPEPQALGETVDLGCPLAPEDGPVPPIRVRVVAWCATPAVRDQAQFKFKVWVENSSEEVADIGQSQFRLLVGNIDHQRWSSPEIGTPSTQRPIRVSYEGRQVWAIPSNPDGAYDVFSDGAGATFATHWSAAMLDPSQAYKPPLSDRSSGVLVFYVPPVGGSVTELDGIVGVAYMEGRRIKALCPPSRWGPRLAANAF